MSKRFMSAASRLVSSRAGLARLLFGGDDRRRRVLTATGATAFLLLLATAAWACIPWAGEVEVSNVNTSGDENGTIVHGADRTDIDRDGDGEGEGNDQGMVWCAPSSESSNSQDVGQEYATAQVVTDGSNGGKDITITVHGISGCDIALPEDTYTVTFSAGSFVNSNGSSVSSDGDADDPDSDGQDEMTFSDIRTGPSHGGDSEFQHVGDCMDTADGAAIREFVGTITLVEDDDGVDNDDTADDAGGQTRFPADGVDVVTNSHSKSFDLDQLDPDPSAPGTASGICLTSMEEYQHDNNVVGDDTSKEFPVEYGNAIPVQILPSI